MNNNNMNAMNSSNTTSPCATSNSPPNLQLPFTFLPPSQPNNATQSFHMNNSSSRLMQQHNNTNSPISPHHTQQHPDQANFQALINIVIQQPDMRMLDDMINSESMDSSCNVNEYNNNESFQNNMQIDDITTTCKTPTDQCNNNNNGSFVFKEESLDDLLEEGLRKYRHARKAKSLDESSSSFTNLMLQTVSKQLQNARNNQDNMLDQGNSSSFSNNSNALNSNMLSPNQSEFSQVLQQQRLLMNQNQLSKSLLQPSQTYRRNSMFEMSQTNNTISTFNNFHLGSIPSPDSNVQGSDSDSSSNFQVSTPSISVTNLANNNAGKKKRITITNSNVPQAFDFDRRRNSSSSNSSVTFNTNEYQDFYQGTHETQQKDKKRKALKFTEFTPNSLKR